MYPSKFEKLIDALRKLPGVGLKSAERYAFEMLKFTEEEVDAFIESLIGLKEMKYCSTCGNLSEEDTCDICKDPYRDHKTICVVQHAKDVIAMEKTQEYHGVYHVLNGVISTSKGVMPEDLNIDALMNRVDETIKEIIIATDPTVEGETTALYVARLLDKKGAHVTRLAHGLPMGGHLDYADELTIIKAMEGRKKI